MFCSVFVKVAGGKRNKNKTMDFRFKRFFFSFLKCKLFLVVCIPNPHETPKIWHGLCTHCNAHQPTKKLNNTFVLQQQNMVSSSVSSKKTTTKKIHPRKLTWQWKQPPFEDVLHREHGGFSNASHVRFQGRSSLQNFLVPFFKSITLDLHLISGGWRASWNGWQKTDRSWTCLAQERDFSEVSNVFVSLGYS